MNYSLGYKDIQGSSSGANTAFEVVIDADVIAALGDILARAKARCAALTSLAFVFAT